MCGCFPSHGSCRGIAAGRQTNAEAVAKQDTFFENFSKWRFFGRLPARLRRAGLTSWHFLNDQIHAGIYVRDRAEFRIDGK